MGERAPSGFVVEAGPFPQASTSATRSRSASGHPAHLHYVKVAAEGEHVGASVFHFQNQRKVILTRAVCLLRSMRCSIIICL